MLEPSCLLMRRCLRGARRRLPLVAALLLASCSPPAVPPCCDTGSAAPTGYQAAPDMTNPPPGSPLFVGVNFWNIDWQGQQEYFRPDADFATTDNPWRDELIEGLRPFRVLRFMDWNDTNLPVTSQASFATRKTPRAEQNQPVAFEWQLDLCNRAQKDCWLTVHHTATPDDWRQLAELALANLQPSLRLYVEWSNEVWNGSFPQHQYAAESARKLGLGTDNPAAAFNVHASVRMFEQFSRVFAGHEHRLVRVLSGQAGWAGPCEAQRAALADARINPQQTRPDVYAIAPYVHGSSISELQQAMKQVTGAVPVVVECARRMGVPLVAYEGGTDSFALRDGCSTIQQDPAMRPLYRAYLQALEQAGMRGPFMHYTFTGGCWGLKQRIGDAAERSPRLQGVIEWQRLDATDASSRNTP